MLSVTPGYGVVRWLFNVTYSWFAAVLEINAEIADAMAPNQNHDETQSSLVGLHKHTLAQVAKTLG